MPDLFSATPPAKGPDPAAANGKAETQSPGLRPRHLLPKDLAGSLRRLDDVEIDTLLSAVTKEAERRGRLPKRKSVPDAKSQARQTAIEEVAGGLTKGKLNAVRAAFKAGVKPSVIAREFGISQSDVRRALAQGRRREG